MNKKEYLITRTVLFYSDRHDTDNTPITVPSINKYRSDLKKSHPNAVRIEFNYDVIETIQIKKP